MGPHDRQRESTTLSRALPARTSFSIGMFDQPDGAACGKNSGVFGKDDCCRVKNTAIIAYFSSLDNMLDVDTAAAFESVYRKHSQAVLRYAMKCVGRADVAEEITSDAFLALHRSESSPTIK